MITLNSAKTGFLDEDGRAYVPFGVNYYDHETGWAPKIWTQFDPRRVREQFLLMKRYGVNCARFFIASTAFMGEGGHLAPDAAEKLDWYLDCARETGIRVIPTGPDHWEGVPEFAKPDLFCGKPYLDALDVYLRDMIARYGDRPEIFAWDLRNEPMVGWDSEPMREGWQRFLHKKYGCQKQLTAAWRGELGGDESLTDGVDIPADAWYEGSARLYDYQLYREQIAYDWTKRQVDVIRASGDRHLVTIGYIQWSFPGHFGIDRPSGYAAFRPRMLAPLLDFDCAHFYPVIGDPAQYAAANLRCCDEWLRYCDVTRPVVLEEYGWYGGGAVNEHQTYRPLEDQDRWNTALVEATRGAADGWLSWPFADTPTSTDISKFGGLVTASLHEKPWGESFRRLAAEAAARAGEPKAPRVPFDFDEHEYRRLVTGGAPRARYL